MIDGTYRVGIDTPLGRQMGKAIIRTKGDKVFVRVNAPVVGRRSAEGHVDGNTFSAQGTLMIMFIGKVKYSLEGEIIGDEGHFSIKSSKGNFEFTGTRE